MASQDVPAMPPFQPPCAPPISNSSSLSHSVVPSATVGCCVMELITWVKLTRDKRGPATGYCAVPISLDVVCHNLSYKIQSLFSSFLQATTRLSERTVELIETQSPFIPLLFVIISRKHLESCRIRQAQQRGPTVVSGVTFSIYYFRCPLPHHFRSLSGKRSMIPARQNTLNRHQLHSYFNFLIHTVPGPRFCHCISHNQMLACESL